MRTPEAKVWGTTIELFSNTTASMHYIEVVAGGFCSEHRHEHKENIFFVIEGELKIAWWDIDGEEHTRILRDGDSCTVPIAVWHQFEATAHTRCIEIYDYRYYGVDIERRIAGGLHEYKRD